MIKNRFLLKRKRLILSQVTLGLFKNGYQPKHLYAGNISIHLQICQSNFTLTRLSSWL